jgi:hypothetical protein
MEIKALFGLLSSTFLLVGCIPYLRDIYKNNAQPHILSWMGWGFITALGAFAMLAEGSAWTVAILFTNTFVCFLVAIYSALKGNGVWSTTILDYIFFGIGILGLILWQSLHLPILALICAIVADFSFGVPTVIKTFKNPNSETWLPWFMSMMAGLFSLFTIQGILFHEVAYPLYLFLFDLTVLLIVIKVIKKKKFK